MGEVCTDSATEEHHESGGGKKLIKIFNKGRMHYQYASFVDAFLFFLLARGRVLGMWWCM